MAKSAFDADTSPCPPSAADEQPSMEDSSDFQAFLTRELEALHRRVVDRHACALQAQASEAYKTLELASPPFRARTKSWISSFGDARGPASDTLNGNETTSDAGDADEPPVDELPSDELLMRRRSKRSNSIDSCGSLQEFKEKLDQSRAEWAKLDQSAAERRFALSEQWARQLELDLSRTVSGVSRTKSQGNADELRSLNSGLSELFAGELTDLEKWAARRCNHYVADPSNKLRLVWDVLGLLLIFYDLFTIPLMVFTTKDTAFTLIMKRILCIFWTCDLFFSFCVGYYEGGIVIRNAAKIAKRYLRTWFILDVVLVTIEWVMWALESTNTDQAAADERGLESLGVARLSKTIRVLRLLRLFRLLRLMKLPGIVVKIEETIQSEVTNVAISLVKFTFLIICMNHYIACLWYGLGALESPQYTWIRPAYGPSFEDSSPEYFYFTAVHWALTQLTPGSMEVFCQNLDERVYNVVVLIFTLITFSTFISSITHAMTQLRNMNSEHAKKILIFQRYLRFHKIDTSLSVRMRRHLEHRLLRTHQAIEERDVEILNFLSDPLRMELHFQVYVPVLEHHAFFKQFAIINVAPTRKLCHVAITQVSLSQGDLLFSSGDACGHMYIVAEGTLQYIKVNRGVNVESVRRGDWLSEACLWTTWSHCGEATAKLRSNLIALDANKWLEVCASACRTSSMRLSFYAELFVQHLNALQEHMLSDLTSATFDEEANTEMCLEDAVDADDPKSPVIKLRHSQGSSSTPPQAMHTEDNLSTGDEAKTPPERPKLHVHVATVNV